MKANQMGRLAVYVLKAMSLLIVMDTARAATKQDYYSLYAYLFEDPGLPYKKEFRPAMNESHTIIVEVDFYLSSIISVDEKEQTLVTSGNLFMSWEDSFLSWNATHYGHISELLVPQNILYLPDVIAVNSVRAAAQLGYPQQQTRLYDSGTVVWVPNVLLWTSCDIDITYFPFDSQICKIRFETAVSENYEILLKMSSVENAFSLQDFSPNGQWQLVAISAEDRNQKGTKASVEFGLLLKRRRIFYVLNIVIPVFFLSLTSSLVFALPADEGEKMGTGITILLSFAVYLTIVSDLVPNTSLQVSVLAVYLTTLLGMCAVGVVVCAFILRLHFREEDWPVGPKMIKITRQLQRLTCLKRPQNIPSNKVTPQMREDTQDSLPVKTNGIKSTNEEPTGDNNIAWKDVAKSLDETFFILFTVLSCITTISCLVILFVGGSMNAPELSNPIFV